MGDTNEEKDPIVLGRFPWMDLDTYLFGLGQIQILLRCPMGASVVFDFERTNLLLFWVPTKEMTTIKVVQFYSAVGYHDKLVGPHVCVNNGGPSLPVNVVQCRNSKGRLDG